MFFSLVIELVVFENYLFCSQCICNGPYSKISWEPASSLEELLHVEVLHASSDFVHFNLNNSEVRVEFGSNFSCLILYYKFLPFIFSSTIWEDYSMWIKVAQSKGKLFDGYWLSFLFSSKNTDDLREQSFFHTVLGYFKYKGFKLNLWVYYILIYIVTHLASLHKTWKYSFMLVPHTIGCSAWRSMCFTGVSGETIQQLTRLLTHHQV